MSPGAAATAPPAVAPAHPARHRPGRAVGRSPGEARRGPTPPVRGEGRARATGRAPLAPAGPCAARPECGVRARGAQPWAGGAGGRSGGRAGGRSGAGPVSPAGAAATRRARGGRRRPRLHCLRRGARSHLRAFSAQFGGSGACTTPSAPDARTAAPAATKGRAGGGLKWKCAPGRGGQAGADVQRPRAARPARPPSPGARRRRRERGRWAGLSAGVDRRRADRGLRGRPGAPPEPGGTPELRTWLHKQAK